MNKPVIRLLCVGAFLWGGVASNANADVEGLSGARLYVTKACAGCHGLDGRSPKAPLYPKVAGQNAAYLYNQMRDIKSGSRSNGASAMMKGLMSGVSDAEMRAIANWLTTQ